MIRWVAAMFVGLFVFYPLLPWLDKLGVGRIPGDVRFQWRHILLCLPFGSTLLWSALAFALAELMTLFCVAC